MRGAICGLASVWVLGTALAASAAGIITTIAGGGPAPNSPALAQPVGPIAVAVDAAGNLFVSDLSRHQIVRADATTGILSVFAGSGDWGPCADPGDGGPATAACLYPGSLTFDAAGDLYIGDWYNQRVRRVDVLTGIIETVAGGGTSVPGDGGPATLAVVSPGDVAFDASGNMFVTDHSRIRRVDAATHVITTVSFLNSPGALAFNASGDLFVGDFGAHRVYRLAGGTSAPTVVAGNGSTTSFCGDGGPATAACVYAPNSLAFDQLGRLLISESDSYRIRRVDLGTGVITTMAGTGAFLSNCPKTLGDGGPATAACFGAPFDIATDAAGDVFVADWGSFRLRRIDAASGTITTVVSNGDQGFCGDGGPATSACIDQPYGVARNAAGDLFIADTYNARIRRVDAATGAISTVAGSAYGGFFGCALGNHGDGGPATEACFDVPSDVAVDANGDVLVPDNGVVRRVDHTTGIITTAFGSGGPGFCGDGGPASLACLGGILGMAVDPAGNVFLADAYNYRVRRIDALTGVISTVAGNGEYSSCGDGGLATDACMFPLFVAVDTAGNLFITDNFNGSRIRRVDALTRIITTVVGGGTAPCVEGGPATNDCLAESPAAGLTVDVLGNLFFADGLHVKRVDAFDGTITTVAGSNDYTFCGDGGPATSACIGTRSVVVDPDGALLIADVPNNRIRRVACDGPDTDGDGRCDAYDFDEIAGLSMRETSVKRSGRKGKIDFDLDVSTAPYSAVGDPSAFFAQARATGFTLRTTASGAPPALAELAVVAATPDQCKHSPVGAAMPTRVRCKTKGVLRSRFRMVQLDAAGGYRLVGTIKLPQVSVPTSGVLRLALSVNGASGRDYEAAAATCTAVGGRRPAFLCTGAP